MDGLLRLMCGCTEDVGRAEHEGGVEAPVAASDDERVVDRVWASRRNEVEVEVDVG